MNISTNQLITSKLEYKLYIQDILLSLANVVDLMNPALNEHHKHVAYISYRIATTLGYNQTDIQHIVLAALLHDIGAFSEQERLSLLHFEDYLYSRVHFHAEVGYQFLREFPLLEKAASYIRFHHRSWQPVNDDIIQDVKVPKESYIIHLADRISVLIRRNQNILRQTNNIRTRVATKSSVFPPELLEAFYDTSRKEEFWLNTLYEPVDEVLCHSIGLETLQLNSAQFESLIDLFRRIIDFRSIFTSVHSSGVAAVAVALAEIAGFSHQEIHMIKYAGYLHDLGKIAIPSEILEKPSYLAPHEQSIIRIHPYHTDRILRPIKMLDTIRIWAAQHHERLDGNGYPFHYNQNTLSLGSRILAVADVFTALTEDRPYRSGIQIVNALDIIKNMANDNILDKEVYEQLRHHIHDMNQIRITAQTASRLEYKKFAQNIPHSQSTSILLSNES
jgi:putative nucleotidyltransferase with HDIG domain